MLRCTQSITFVYTLPLLGRQTLSSRSTSSYKGGDGDVPHEKAANNPMLSESQGACTGDGTHLEPRELQELLLLGHLHQMLLDVRIHLVQEARVAHTAGKAPVGDAAADIHSGQQIVTTDLGKTAAALSRYSWNTEQLWS